METSEVGNPESRATETSITSLSEAERFYNDAEEIPQRSKIRPIKAPGAFAEVN